MNKAKRIGQIPVIGRLAMLGFRAVTGGREPLGQVGRFLRWLPTSREFTNYTYDLTPLNERHLHAFVSHVTGLPTSAIKSYCDELHEDQALRDHIDRTTLQSSDAPFADRHVRYGRRLGWYALVRATKPRLVVETGIDKGLGACVLSAALLRNAAEGSGGRYLGIDINPGAGVLYTPPYSAVGEIVTSDSVQALEKVTEEIGVFISDSDHTAGYETREYQAILQRLSGDSIVISDNAHASGELIDFAASSGMQFLYYQEEPLAHWHRGAGIGVAWAKRDGRD